MGIDILIPVLNRPRNAHPLVNSITSTTSTEHEVHFLCSPLDMDEISAARATGANVLIVDWPPGKADFAKKINYGYRHTSREWLFMGADDIRFHPGWDVQALRMQKRVVGTADLGNPESKRTGSFSTHVLIARSYVDELGTIDGPGQVLSEAYDHNWVDRELADTAHSRGEWAYCPRSIVEHLHFHWGKGQSDSTYKKGLKRFSEDRRLYRQRMNRARIRVR